MRLAVTDCKNQIWHWAEILKSSTRLGMPNNINYSWSFNSKLLGMPNVEKIGLRIARVFLSFRLIWWPVIIAAQNSSFSFWASYGFLQSNGFRSTNLVHSQPDSPPSKSLRSNLHCIFSERLFFLLLQPVGARMSELLTNQPDSPVDAKRTRTFCYLLIQQPVCEWFAKSIVTIVLCQQNSADWTWRTERSL